MKIIEIKSDNFYRLTKPLNDVCMACESSLYLFADKTSGRQVLAKMFTGFQSENTAYLRNKKYTLRKLDEYREKITDSSFVLPDKLISISPSLFGFTTEFFPNSITLGTLLSDDKCPVEKKVYYLKEVGKILKKVRDIRNKGVPNFYLNDLHEDNFIIDENGILRVVDLDSCSIAENLPVNTKYLYLKGLLRRFPEKYRSNNLNDYSFSNYVPDENTDLYCYIYIILSIITDNYRIHHSFDIFNQLLTFLKENGISLELIDSIARIYTKENNTNPYELLDMLVPYLKQKRLKLEF